MEQKEIFEKSKQHSSSSADCLLIFLNGLNRKDENLVIAAL